MELYLNRVFFGRRSYGLEAASRAYFDKMAKELSVDEAAFLAGLLRAPSYLSRPENIPQAQARKRLILKQNA